MTNANGNLLPPAGRPGFPTLARLGAVLSLVILVTAGAAHAQGLDPAVRQACSADYKSLCSDVQPGGGRIIGCLKQNADKVSTDCRKAVAARKGG